MRKGGENVGNGKGVKVGWKRRKRAAIKAIFAAYVSLLSLFFFSIQSLRGLGRDRRNYEWDMLFSRGG